MIIGVGVPVMIFMILIGGGGHVTPIDFEKDGNSQLVLIVTIPDSKVIENTTQENVIAYGFLWIFTEDEFTKGILTNIHIQDGKIFDTWHSEIIKTNYNQNESFCIIPEKVIESVKITDNQIFTTIESDYLVSDNYLTVKIVEDYECNSHFKAIVVN